MSSIFPTEDTIEKLLISLTADKNKAPERENSKLSSDKRTAL